MESNYRTTSVLLSGGINIPTRAKYQGWSVAGIKCYNELYDMIDKEQKSGPGIKFEEHFLEFCMNGKEASKHNHLKKKNMVYEACCHDLWEMDDVASTLDEGVGKKISEYDSDASESAGDMKVTGSTPNFKYFGSSDSEVLEDDEESCQSSCGNDSVAGRND